MSLKKHVSFAKRAKKDPGKILLYKNTSLLQKGHWEKTSLQNVSLLQKGPWENIFPCAKKS